MPRCALLSCGPEAGPTYRFRAKMEQLEGFEGLLPGSQGQNLASTVLCVPSSLDSGQRCRGNFEHQFNINRLNRANANWVILQGYLAHKKLPPP